MAEGKSRKKTRKYGFLNLRYYYKKESLQFRIEEPENTLSSTLIPTFNPLILWTSLSIMDNAHFFVSLTSITLTN